MSGVPIVNEAEHGAEEGLGDLLPVEHMEYLACMSSSGVRFEELLVHCTASEHMTPWIVYGGV